MMSRRALFGWMLPDHDAPAPQAAGVPVEPQVPARGRVAWQQARRHAALDLGPKVAVVSPFLCLNAGADFCATCVERCPEPGALRLDGRRVVVDSDRCSGCGVCLPLCPAPGGAILLRPVS